MAARKCRRSFESLEPRMCLSVTTLVSGGNLIIQGEADGRVEVTAVDVGKFEVKEDGVIVDTLEGVTKDVRLRLDGSGGSTDDDVVVDLAGTSIHRLIVDLGDGDNRLEVKHGTINRGFMYRGGSGKDLVHVGSDAVVDGNIDLRLGAGNNEVFVEGDVGKSLRIVGHSGDDEVVIAASASIDRGVHASLGSGDDRVAVEGEVGGDLEIHASAGDDTIEILAAAIVERSARIFLGKGDNALELTGSVEGNLIVEGGSGNDEVHLHEDSHVGDDTHIRLDGGDNRVAIDGTIDGDLRVTSGNADDQFVVGESAAVGGTTSLTPGEQGGHGRRDAFWRLAQRRGRLFRR